MMDVEVRQSKLVGGGRGLFAKKSFDTGDVVYTTSRPFVAELDTTRLQDTCAWCFRQPRCNDESANEETAVLPCAACKRVRYCSKTCQSKAWKREHKYECKAIAPQDRPDLPHGVRAVIKLLGRLQADPQGKDEQLIDILRFQPYADEGLLAAMKKAKPQRCEDFDMLAYGAWKYAGEPKIGDVDSLGLAKGFFYNVMNNTISLSGMEDVSLGTGFDPIVCSANHSCDPNTIVVFNQPTLVVRALRPIPAGEEICIKYIDITNPRSVRQAELHDQYYFECKCSRCEQGSEAREDRFLKPIDQLNPTFSKVADGLIQRHTKQLERFAIGDNASPAQQRLAAISAEAFSVSGITFDFNKGNEHASEDETRDALRLCLNSGMWDWARQPVPHLLRQLLVAKLSTGQTYAAWRIAAKMHFLTAPILFPTPSYPDRLLDAWTLANITNQLISPDDDDALYREILRGGLDLRIVSAGLILEVHEHVTGSYGRDSPLGRAVEAAHRQLTAAMQISNEELREEIRRTWPKFEAVARSADVLNV